MRFAELVLYEDNHLLVVNKPAGILVQGDRTGAETLLSAAKAYLKEKYSKPGNVYLGLVHRLDRVTSGVVIFARTSKAAARLTRAFQERLVKKFYLAVVHGHFFPEAGLLVDRLFWQERKRRAHLAPVGKEARLGYQSLLVSRGYSLLFLKPYTGRKHQIRAQLAVRGFPVVGDLKYGSRKKIWGGRAILLHAWALLFPHPTRYEEIFITAPLPFYWPKDLCPRDQQLFELTGAR